MEQTDRTVFPGLRTRTLGSGITWTFYKHWGQGCWAGEGLLLKDGDRSGCLEVILGRQYVRKPLVVQARFYQSPRGDISAVYSYPHGIGVCDHYFWEIWSPRLLEDVERFDTEEEMEARVMQLLG